MTVNQRLTPFDAVFGSLAPERFPVLREGIASAGADGRDRDAFVLVREVVELLRELAPDQIGEGVGELVAFVHACYRYWLDGERRVAVARDSLERLLRDATNGSATVTATGASYYLQLAPQRVWGTPVEGAPPEPLDGWFAMPAGDVMSLVAVFGVHPGRAGLTVVPAAGGRAARLSREDGSPLFSPQLAGGAVAQLFQIVGEAELVELAFRLHGLLGPAGALLGTEEVTVG